MRRVVIVGNGFIHHLNDLVRAERSRLEKFDSSISRSGIENCDRLSSELDKVSSLFHKFDTLQEELSGFFRDEVKYEVLFEKLDALLDWYRNKNQFKDVIADSCFISLEILVERIISEKILPVVRSFEEQELNRTYGALTLWIGQELVGDRIYSSQQRSKDQIGVFTTNYDGFLTQILRRSSAENSGYLFQDGFGLGERSHLVPYDPNFSDSNFLAHLHSSYRIGYKGDILIKTKLQLHNERNTMPILVYMNPLKKLDYMMKHYILRRYWESFRSWIHRADEIVIYGNSLRSDPHIVTLVEKAGSRKQKKLKIYVADRTPKDVLGRLSFALSIKPELLAIDISKIGLEDLHLLFSEPSKLV